MSQRSITTTTSFIISSDESLNKPPLSSSQSTSSASSNDIMTTTSDSIQNNNNQYFVSLDPVNNNMVHNQQNRLHPSVLPPPPPTYSLPQGQIYGTSTTNGTDRSATNIDTTANNTTNLQQQQQQTYGHINLNLSQCNGNSDSNNSPIYSIYNQNNPQQSPNPDCRLNTQTSPNVNQFQQYQIYLSANNSSPTSNEKSNDSSLHNQQPIYGQSLNNTSATYGQVNYSSTYSPKSNNSVQSFYNNKQLNSGQQRTSISSLQVPISSPLMPVNVKAMLLHGVSGDEVIRTWLSGINCEEYLRNFTDHGYDMPLITTMTPQDLTAIGCRSPKLRKKLLLEIKKLNLDDDIPECRPGSLEQWLELLKLGEYYVRLCDEGYDSIDKVCELTWEDLEEIGINKLGHQKRLLLGIERLRKYDKLQEERLNDFAIYDVHPNHRVSLNQISSDNRLGTLGRSTMRSGFFQTRQGAHLDHRGLPVATVVPALKHLNNSLANLEISQQVITKADGSKTISPNANGFSNNRLSMTNQNFASQSPAVVQGNLEPNGYKMSDLTSTIKRNPPPLPPVRTNSLKMPFENGHNNLQNNNNSIYGTTNNHYGMMGDTNGGNYAPPATTNTGSTSFLRTPRLGTLTATTNKMLTLGGHIHSVNGQPTTLRSMMPVRDAPLPPIPAAAPAAIPEKIDEEPTAPPPPPIVLNAYDNNSVDNSVGNFTMINQSSIEHQLASADEFPPPPPSQ